MQRSVETADRDVEGWFRQARDAGTLEEMLSCLQHAHRLNPYHPQAQQLTRRALWRILQKEPFLLYHDETDHLYFVWNGLDLTLSVPKNRTPPDPYPPPEPRPLSPAWRALAWATLGLALGGLGALVFAPIALYHALDVLLDRPLRRADWTRAVIVTALSMLLWVGGLALGLLLLLHMLA